MKAHRGIPSLGIGVDIEEIKRFVGLNLENDRSFFRRVFTPKELAYCFSKANPSSHLAARFAAKEAVLKALKGSSSKISLNEIEILNEPAGNPIVRIKNKRFSNAKVLISLSHSRDQAIAFALGGLPWAR